LVNAISTLGLNINLLQRDDIRPNRFDNVRDSWQIQFTINAFTMMDVVRKHSNTKWFGGKRVSIKR